jgi:hypothetical protein
MLVSLGDTAALGGIQSYSLRGSSAALQGSPRVADGVEMDSHDLALHILKGESIKDSGRMLLELSGGDERWFPRRPRDST